MYAHGGIVAAAAAILTDMQHHKLLHRLLEEFDPYGLDTPQPKPGYAAPPCAAFPCIAFPCTASHYTAIHIAVVSMLCGIISGNAFSTLQTCARTAAPRVPDNLIALRDQVCCHHAK